MILGILSATALPKFIDMSTDAGNAAAQGVAGAISSGSAINLAKYQITPSAATRLNAANICTTTLAGSLVTGVTVIGTGTPDSNSKFLIGGTGDCSGTSAAGTAVTCTITGQKGAAQNASVICTG